MRKLTIILPVLILIGIFYFFSGNEIWLKIINDKGVPIPQAQVRFGWTSGQPWGPSTHSGTPHSMERVSDSRGFVSARISENQHIGVKATASGHYPSTLAISGSSIQNCGHSSKALSFPLKEIHDPSALIAKKANIILPAREGKVGYDFLLGDLIAPYGKGQHQDIIFTWLYDPNKDGYQKRALWDFYFTTQRSGVLARRPSPLDLSSDLKSDPIAPSEGYTASLRIAEDRAKFGERGPWGPAIYYFTTERADKLLYGKILGEPQIIFYSNGKTVIKFVYAINPSGSLSLEPDMTRIIFQKSNDWEEPYTLPEGS